MQGLAHAADLHVVADIKRAGYDIAGNCKEMKSWW
jgi:hypothetical protein